MEQTRSDDGTVISFQLLGSGAKEPLLVVPGGPCRGPEYLGDLAGLARERPLAVLQLRGTQATGGLSRGWWADAADLVAVSNALGLLQPDVLAHSAGARLALAAAARFPGKLRSLTLITPAAAWLTGTAHDGATVADRRPEPEILDAVESMDREPQTEAEFQSAWTTQAPAGYAHWGATEKAHAEVGAMSFAAATAWFNDIPDDAATQVLEASIPPTLVIGGEEDILSGVESVRAMAAALGATLRMLPGCGHYPWAEQPEAFMQRLRSSSHITRR